PDTSGGPGSTFRARRASKPGHNARERFGCMRVSPRFPTFAALLGGALLAALPAGADTPTTTQWVVTSAKASGGGNDYVSSLRIVTPNASAAPVDLYFLPASSNGSGDNAGAAKVSVSVPANGTLAIDDVVASKFGATGAGGIRVESSAPFNLPVWVLS